MNRRQKLFQAPEKSLYDIYRKSRLIKKKRFNGLVTLFVSVLLIVYVCLTEDNPSVLAAKIYNWVDFGLNFVIAILGFLIAGFTIFATVGDKNLYLFMSLTDKEPGLSNLKYGFFMFMEVFIIYIAIGAMLLAIKLFVQGGGLLQIIARTCFLDYVFFKHIASKVGIVFIGSTIVYMLLLLKSFVYNIYHVVMIMVQVREETHDVDIKELLLDMIKKKYGDKVDN